MCHIAFSRIVYVWAVLGLAAILVGDRAGAQADSSPPDFRAWQAIITPLRKKEMLSAYYERMVVPKVLRYESAGAWAEQKRELRAFLWECLGLEPRPALPAIDLRILGALDRPDYTMQRVAWQSFPRIYATGYLYLPKALRDKAPGILCPNGHFDGGTRHPVEQSRCIAFAKKGYVVLAVDSVHVGDFGMGVTPMTAMIWNLVRGLDLLVSLPQVDPTKLGCVGASGGGQQTMYLMALDDRLAVAAPAVLVADFRKIMFYEGVHCWCNHLPDVMKRLDQPEMAMLFAPKPALFECVTGDWTARFPTDEFPRIQRLYRAMGAEENVAMKQFPGPHDFNRPMRELVYGWFDRHLKDKQDATPSVEPEVVPETAETLAGLDHPVPGDLGMTAIGGYLRGLRAGVSPGESSSERVATSSAAWAKLLPGMLGQDRAEVRAEAPLNGKVLDNWEGAGWRAEKTTIDTEPGITCPGLMIRPDGRSDRRPVLVIVRPEGRSVFMDAHGPRDWLLDIVKGGVAVLLPDTRGRGELSIDWWANGLLWGRSPAAMAAHDLSRWIAYVRSRPDVDGARLALVGQGAASLESALAAVLAPSIAGLGVDQFGFERGPNLDRIGSPLDLLGSIPVRHLHVGAAGRDAAKVEAMLAASFGPRPGSGVTAWEAALNVDSVRRLVVGVQAVDRLP